MVKYTCEQCGKEFSQKSHYDSHIKRKIPCENNVDKIKLMVDKAVEEKLQKLNMEKLNLQPTNIQNKYSDLSIKLTKQIDINEKKQNGIYFTPPETIINNIKMLEPYMKNIKTVLEPACGSCEYISRLNTAYPNMNITGIELNKTIYDSIKHYDSGNIKIFNSNYLSHEFNMNFDLIIGNPPYFVMNKIGLDKSYTNYYDGRPNIFILFIIKSLGLLNDKGIISFVLPRNFLNCLYYDKTRKHIIDNYNILNIVECNDKYIDTQQDTIILILQKEKPINNTIYSINISEYTIFGTQNNIDYLKLLYTDSKTLFELGFNVNVGNIVWNQCKKDLTDDDSKTLLIYSSNIKDNKLSIIKYSNEQKKNYINKDGIKTPLLVINRGYGVGSYVFNYCLINDNENENDNICYLVENHLICIKCSNQLSQENLIKKYKNIIKSFENEKTKQFIKIYFGNNAINTTELCKILPIYEI